MASQLHSRTSTRTPRGRRRHLVPLRAALALTLPLLTTPFLGAPAGAEQPVTEPEVVTAVPEPAAGEPGPAAGEPEPALEEAPSAEAAEPCDPGTLVGPFPTADGDRSFEIDGDLDACEGNLDWTSDGITGVFPDGVDDATQFQGSSKEFGDPATWAAQPGNAPDKADIVDAYAHSMTATNGDVYAFFGFTRAATNGTTTYDVEFNQQPNSTDDVPRPDRTPGDLLVQFAQQGNAGSNIFVVQGAYLWTLRSDPAWHTDKDNATPDCVPVPGYTPAAGWCPVDPLPDAFVGDTSGDDYFAEGALNLTEFFGRGTCVGDYATINIRSRAADSPDAALADWVATPGISVEGTCADIVIEKRDTTSGRLVDVPGTTFLVEPDPSPGSAVAGMTVTDNDFEVGAGELADLDDTVGVIRISPVEPGEYSVTETAAPTGYLLPPHDGRSQTLTVAPSGTTTFVFQDSRRWEPLSVTKTADGTYDVAYTWSIDKQVDDTYVEIASGTHPFEYTVTVAEEDRITSGHEVTGVVTVSNPNPYPVQATLADELSDTNGTCEFDDGAQVTVPADDPDGTGTDYAYTCTFGGAGPEELDGGTNQVNVEWSRSAYPQSAEDIGAAGTYTATAEDGYTFTVDDERNRTVSVTDSRYDTWDTTPWTITWGDEEDGVYVESYTLPWGSEAGTCATYDNTARLLDDQGAPLTDTAGEEVADTVAVEVCVGADLGVEKDAGVTYEREFLWDVDKTGPGTVVVGESVDPETGAKSYTTSVRYEVRVTQAGTTDTEQTLGGEITVTNPNDWQDVYATVTDQVDLPGVTCEITGGRTAADPALVDADPDTDGFQVLVPRKEYDGGRLVEGSNVVTLTYECTGMSSGDYSGTNTAVATWDTAIHPSPTGRAHDTAVISDGGPTGAGVNEQVYLTDSMLGDQVFGPFDYDTHDPDDTVTYTVDGLGTSAGTCTPHRNTATLAGTGVSDTVTVEVCAPAISKSVDATYDLRYPWSISKTVVGDSRQDIAADGEAEFHYLVTALPGMPTEQDHELAGRITLSNPDGSLDLEVEVTDQVGLVGVTCTITDATGAVVEGAVHLAAGDTVPLDYVCALPTGFQAPAGDVTSTVTASWADGRVTATGTTEFTVDEEIDKEVTIRDSRFTPLTEWRARWQLDPATGEPRSVPFQYDYTYPGDDIAPGTCTGYDNTAWIVEHPDQRDTATVTVCVDEAPAIDVDKTAGEVVDTDEPANGAGDVGDTVSYEFEVTNEGNVTLTGIVVTDPMFGGVLTCDESTLAPGESMECEAQTHVLTQADVDAGLVENTVTATGESPEGERVRDSDSTTTVLPGRPAIALVKTAGGVVDTDEPANGAGDVGDTITYGFEVTNEGNVTLTGIVVTDPMFGGKLACETSTLAPGDAMACVSQTHVLTQVDVDRGLVENTADVVGTAPDGEQVTDESSTRTPVTPSPQLSLDKEADPTTYDSVGDVISYSYTLQNTGNVTLAGPFAVTDDKTTVTCPATPTLLAPGEELVCTATYAVTAADISAGSVTNVAVGQGWFRQEPVASNQDTATVRSTYAPPPPPPPATASVKVLKVDAETGRAIDTAKFRLWRDTGSTPGVLDAADALVAPGEVATGTAGNAAGSYTWTGLGQGGYLLQETAAPTGYQLANPAVSAFTLTAADLGTTVTRTVRNPQKETALRVVKVDDETGERLAGAVFQAYVDDGDTVGVLDDGDTGLGAPVATDADGVAGWSGLRFGGYLVEEVTAPDGYDLPAQTVQAVTVAAANAGGVLELRFLDPALGTLTLAKAAFEADGSGGWVPSDGQVEFGDSVRYVVTATATGPRILRDVVVTDYVPGHDPADTTSTTEATYLPGSAACVDEGPCGVDFDAASQLVTWELGDLRDESRRVELVVEFPPVGDDAVPVDGYHRAVLANVAAASWTDRDGDHTALSDEVVVAAVAEILPTEEERPPAPPVKPRPPAILPETGAPAGNGTLSLLGGILLAVGALLMARRRRDVS